MPTWARKWSKVSAPLWGPKKGNTEELAIVEKTTGAKKVKNTSIKKTLTMKTPTKNTSAKKRKKEGAYPLWVLILLLLFL